nr:glutamine amidotransferase [Pseudomarimonas arenosa]
MARFLIIETGRPLPSLRRWRDFPHWIRVAARLRPQQVELCRVAEGQPLPQRNDWLGVMITGSGAMVSERLPWSETCAEWLRQQQGPLLGICYGHQLLAHAFGGEVGYHPAGREMGSAAVELRAEAAWDPLFAGLPKRFLAQTTHMQTVLQPPPGAVVLAENAHERCNAFRLGTHQWGVQFHPEFSTRHIRGYIHARRPQLMAEGHDWRGMWADVRPAPWSRKLLQRFVAYCHASLR